MNVNVAYNKKSSLDEYLLRAKRVTEAKVRGINFAGMETDDVIQEVLLKVYSKMADYDSSRASIQTFIEAIINSTIKDLFRKAARASNLAVVNALQLVEDTSDVEDEVLASVATVGYEEEGYDYTNSFYDLMNNTGLTEREKEIIELRLKGYSFSEIARALKVSSPRINQMWKKIIIKCEKLYK
ncbi:hypothetical protein E308F_30380 [Moorella sp. E308F]|uniref:sigma-70 family RNA polymerase sigma factor n=1 Tax=Moorella sp. E308F TaxID=2572682 RepID=UPI0010FFC5A9|nr:sigma-70 family RNA polymerase sigma factor [Moorella sp. E308F]GEA16792.1 hypothetical protein E308F_30380 [Moorella sp. E308F]